MNRETVTLALVFMVIILGTYVTTLLTVKHVFMSITEATIANSGWQDKQIRHSTKLVRNKEGEAICMTSC